MSNVTRIPISAEEQIKVKKRAIQTIRKLIEGLAYHPTDEELVEIVVAAASRAMGHPQDVLDRATTHFVGIDLKKAQQQ